MDTLRRRLLRLTLKAADTVATDNGVTDTGFTDTRLRCVNTAQVIGHLEWGGLVGKRA